jgi:AcrR family transcriptional regulator
MGAMDDRVKAILAGLDLWAEWPSRTQRRIVGAALESFAERGFHGTSLKHIAQGSGLSTAALYVHFATKEELLFALSRRGHTLARDLVAQAVEGEPGEALTVLVTAFTQWHAEHRTIARVVQYEQGALTHAHALAIAELRRVTEGHVRGLVQRGVDAGVFTVSDVPGVSAAVLSLGIDVARWYGPRGRWTPVELGELYAGLAARMLGAPHPTTAHA